MARGKGVCPVSPFLFAQVLALETFEELSACFRFVGGRGVLMSASCPVLISQISLSAFQSPFTGLRKIQASQTS